MGIQGNRQIVQHGGGIVVRNGQFESVRIFEMLGAESGGFDTIADAGLGRTQGQSDYVVRAVRASEGVWRSAKNSYVVLEIDSDDFGLQQARRRRGQANENAGLAAIVKFRKDMRGGEEIAVAIDEESVAVKNVVITAVAGRVIELINDRADRSGEVLGRRGDECGGDGRLNWRLRARRRTYASNCGN